MSKKKILIIYIFLSVAILMAFWQVNHFDFINYDDPAYVTKNSHVQNGLTLDGLRWAFTTGHAENTAQYVPLTWISHMLASQLFGLDPHWHHRINLLFHIANSLLLFFVFHRMTKALWQSAFIAALFALHPLHVESVAWVAERKDVLSTFFWMLTMGAYCYYVERPGLRRYLYVLIFFVLGLLSKPMVMTLPFVLLLLDYWPLRRFELGNSGQGIQTKTNTSPSLDKRKGKTGKKNAVTVKEIVRFEKSADSKYSWKMIRQLLWEKIPLFIITVLASIVAYVGHQAKGAIQSFDVLPFSSRIANAFISYTTYIEEMIWPNNLAYFYPYQRWSSWQVLGAVLIFTCITLMVIRSAKRFRYLTVGWLWYVGTLVPVIGLVQTGEYARADRYTYIPLIGLFIMASWGSPAVLGTWRYRQRALFSLSTLILSCFFTVTWTQVGYWQNSVTLFDHALKVTDNNYRAHDTRGVTYVALGNYKQAIADFDKAIEIKPKFTEAYLNRGTAYYHLGNHEQAIMDFDKAIEIKPKFAEAYLNRGATYKALGNYKQALVDYDRAIEINPEYADAFFNRGSAYADLGNHEQAIMDFDKAIEIKPKFAEAYLNRGATYKALGNYKQALVDYDRAIEINPEYADAFSNRGNTYKALGNYKQAIADYDKAIKINPKYAEVYNNRGYAYADLGNHEQALVDYDRAIEIYPKFALAYHNRAASYQTLGNKKQAYEDLKAAATLGDKPAQDFLRSKGISW